MCPAALPFPRALPFGPPCRPRPRATRRRTQGDVLLESLICIAIVAMAAMPLATLASTWLRWGGQHARLTSTLQLAAERAEADEDPWPVLGGDAARVSACDAVMAPAACTPGSRIALAGLPTDALARTGTDTAPVRGIALWMRP